MKYTFNSEKFRKRRKQRYKSQDLFIEALSKKGCKIGRNSISDIENGRVPQDLSLNDVMTFCEVLRCDLDFLLDISDYSTKELETVCTYTGLSEKTALQLHKSKKCLFNIPALLSDLLDNYPSFLAFLLSLEKFLTISLLQKQEGTAIIKNISNITNDDVIKSNDRYEKVIISLQQCQARISELQDYVINDDYIRNRAEENKLGLTAITRDN